jgi:YidC/Oxa1 family membrane protein insertase
VDIFLVFQRPLYWLITNLTRLTLSYGVAIILFTIIIRGALAPLYVAQMKSAKKMQILSPKIKELQKKHGKDREALSKAMMELYRDHNHNPALGCILPIIQIPILWSLFLVLRTLANDSAKIKTWVTAHPHLHSLPAGFPNLPHWDLYQADFIWLYNGLGKPDPIHILPIVAGITQWIQQRMMLNPTNDPQQRQMNSIMQFFPIMIVVFAWTYPSGLAVYWVTSNILMMVIQYFVGGFGCLFTDPFSIPYADASAVSPPKPKSGRGGVVARAMAAKEAQARTEMTRQLGRRAPDSTDGGSSAENDVATPSTKMDRYAQRHARGNSRGRPSAKGAKK